MAKPAVEHITLDNGIVWLDDQSIPGSTAYLSIAARMGAEKERLGRNELEAVHLSEHMFFRAGKLEEILLRAKRLTRKRVRSQGSTDVHYCYYYFYGPNKETPMLFQLAKTALLHPYDFEEFKIERSVVGQELAQRAGQDLWVQLYEATQAALYGKTQYGLSYLERAENVAGLTIGKVQATRDRLFRTSNLGVITLGGFETKKQVNRTFGALPATPSLRQAHCYLPDRREIRVDHDHRAATTCYVRHTLRCGPAWPMGMALGELLALALTGTEDSPIYVAMRIKEGSTYSPKAEFLPMRPEMQLGIWYSSRPDNLERNIASVHNAVDRLASRRMSKADFYALQRMFISDFSDNCNDVDWRLEWYVYNMSLDMQLSPYEYGQIVRGLVPQQLKKAAQDWREGMVTAVFHPSSEEIYTPRTQTGS